MVYMIFSTINDIEKIQDHSRRFYSKLILGNILVSGFYNYTTYTVDIKPKDYYKL